ncbi:hypothetical protein [Bradyrhizobium monzae]|uniref:hypothetical protein n=1 Tax=Bradyrhizobium sp. Oc8 TaxID=2876780 RepID=UPI001F3205DF|nr:hypothetical protein [Bradyrhizobium sp. Oc8]
MDAGLTAAVFGLVGALIGSASSVATIIVQSKLKDRRDRSKQLLDLSLAEFGHHLDLAKSNGGGAILPISAYIYNNHLILKALEDGSFGPETLAEIAQKGDEVIRAINETETKRGRPGVAHP